MMSQIEECVCGLKGAQFHRLISKHRRKRTVAIAVMLRLRVEITPHCLNSDIADAAREIATGP